MARSPRLFLLTCLSLLAVACSPADPSPSTTSVPATPASPSQPQFPVTLVDDDGREVRLDGAPRRIVSLAPSNTEIACALDTCDRLVGVTDFDDYPPEVADITDVVIGAQVDVEKVVATDPELVLAGGNELTPSAVIDQLEELDVPVLALYPESLDEVYADIELVGRALGRSDDAQALIDDMRAAADGVSDAVAGADRPRTFYEVSVFEGTIYTAGDGSFLADLIAAAGGEPITGDALGTIALEDLVAADPELILLGDASYDPSVTPDAVAARPGWSQMSAVQNDRVVSFDDDLMVTRPGPRIVDGLAALARAIHPERFE